MKDKNQITYTFDFSSQDEDVKIEDQNSSFAKLIREAVALSDETIQLEPPSINEELQSEFPRIFKMLCYIAKENEAVLSVQEPSKEYQPIIIEIEFDVLDFDTTQLKMYFLYIIKFAKFITFETKTNGKNAMILEFRIFNV